VPSLPLILLYPPAPTVLSAVPTRRSSDLGIEQGSGLSGVGSTGRERDCGRCCGPTTRGGVLLASAFCGWRDCPAQSPYHRFSTRSEEHTSELQSRENLVCRLLLEKKNSVV